VAGVLSRTLHNDLRNCLEMIGGEHFPWRKIGRNTISAPKEMKAKLAALNGPLVVLHTAPACHIQKYIHELPFNVSIINLGLSARKQENRLCLDSEAFTVRRMHLHAGFPVPCTHFPRALEIVTTGRDVFSRLSTRHVPLAELPSVFTGRRQQTKIIITP
jgi:threonine dehydrogenase-like Zn-dependent dehydrogenase